ncbi:MAG: response regulator [Sphingobacteriaceae bacterium]|nr:response regulator [Sphingobacteriaceae bacterium]
MIKAIAIDDEPLALKVIQGLSNRSGAVDLIETFTNQQKAKEFLFSQPVDLLFLDIQMPAQNGISFYKSLNIQIPVIFTTAYSNYAIDGFNLDAVDYLLKPISQERFDESLKKVKRTLTSKIC